MVAITNVKVDVFDWETPDWRVGSGMRFGGREPTLRGQR